MKFNSRIDSHVILWAETACQTAVAVYENIDEKATTLTDHLSIHRQEQAPVASGRVEQEPIWTGGPSGLDARDVSCGGFGRSDGDLSGGDTAVGDVAGGIVFGQVPAGSGAVADLDLGAGAVIAIEAGRENRVRSDLEGSGPRRTGDREGVVDGGGAVLLDEEGVGVVGRVGDGDRRAGFSIGIGSDADGGCVRSGQEDVASVVAELLAKGGRKRVVVAADGMRSLTGHELALEDFEDRCVAVPPGFDVGLGNAGEVGVRSCAADGIGDDGPLQVGASADGASFERRIDGAFDPQAVVPVGAAVFVGDEEGGGSVRDSCGVAVMVAAMPKIWLIAGDGLPGGPGSSPVSLKMLASTP